MRPSLSEVLRFWCWFFLYFVVACSITFVFRSAGSLFSVCWNYDDNFSLTQAFANAWGTPLCKIMGQYLGFEDTQWFYSCWVDAATDACHNNLLWYFASISDHPELLLPCAQEWLGRWWRNLMKTQLFSFLYGVMTKAEFAKYLVVYGVMVCHQKLTFNMEFVLWL